MVVTILLGVFVADQMWYNLESVQDNKWSQISIYAIKYI